MTQETPSSILIVDDNAAHRTLIKRAINKADISHTLLEAAGLEEARRLLFPEDAPPRSPVLAIIDLNLGDGRGTALIGEIRTNSLLKELPIIALSTSALEEDICESYEQGADCYLIKANDPLSFASDITSSVGFLLTMTRSESTENE